MGKSVEKEHVVSLCEIHVLWINIFFSDSVFVIVRLPACHVLTQSPVTHARIQGFLSKSEPEYHKLMRQYDNGSKVRVTAKQRQFDRKTKREEERDKKRRRKEQKEYFQVSGRQASRKINVSSHSHAPFACHRRTLTGNCLSLPATTWHVSRFNSD